MDTVGIYELIIVHYAAKDLSEVLLPQTDNDSTRCSVRGNNASLRFQDTYDISYPKS